MRLRAWLQRLRPAPLLERRVLVELQIVVYPDHSARFTTLHEGPQTPAEAATVVGAMMGCLAEWAQQHGVQIRQGGGDR